MQLSGLEGQSFSRVSSLPECIATFTGVFPSMTFVATPEPIIKSTFFCLSYPDQSCTNHKDQANCENLHFDDFFSRIDCSKFRIFSPEKIIIDKSFMLNKNRKYTGCVNFSIFLRYQRIKILQSISIWRFLNYLFKIKWISTILFENEHNCLVWIFVPNDTKIICISGTTWPMIVKFCMRNLLIKRMISTAKNVEKSKKKSRFYFIVWVVSHGP